MARRKLSAKQVKYFGTKAQKAALRRKRSNAARPHRKRTRKAASRSNPSRRRPAVKRHRRRAKNPGEIISFVLGNPARRKAGTKVAVTRKRRKKNAGSHAHRTVRRKRMVRSGRARRNPGSIGRPMDWLKGGVAVLGGVLVTRAVPQAVAASYNTGGVGYLMNAGTAIGAAFLTHMAFKDPVLTAGVAAGGFAGVIARIITDMTPFGSYVSSLSGVGDYQFSNFVAPQRLIAWQNAQVQVPQGWNGTPLPALTTGMYSSSSDMGRRGGNC